MNVGERIGLLALLFAIAIAGGCSSMAPESDTYNSVIGTTDGEQTTGGSGGTGTGAAGEGPGDDVPTIDLQAWACLDTGITMPPPMPRRIQYRVNIVDFDSQTTNPIIVPNLSVEVCTTASCDRVLPACEPGTMPTPTQQCSTITQGQLPFIYIIDLPYQLDNGGLKLTAPGYAQMNYVFGGPMVGTPEGDSTVVGLTIPLLTIEARERAYQQVGVDTVDPTRGTLAIRTLSCLRETPNAAAGTPPQGQRTPDITVATDSDAVDEAAEGWSLSNGNQFTPGSLVTDGRGVAGFLNAQPRSIRVRAVLANGEVAVESTLPVLPDVITLAELRPGLEQWGQ